jgi:uncharacterized protein YbjQ (UPF0145 family)
MKDEISLSTLENIPGADIEEHIGLVTGLGVKSTSLITSFVGNMKNFFGGENSAMTELLQEARKMAIEDLTNAAKKMGANAIVNVRLESSKIASGTAEVCAYGTAIKIVKY